MKSPEPGTLFVVATPIGNLEDITLRALRVLKEVALVAAEDTRRTGNLLRHYQIPTRLISLHEHNEHVRRLELLTRLEAGESIAVVSDAGTPGISDPGAGMVRAARDAGIRVEPIPGASAVTAVLSAAGIPCDRFVFGGFPPIRSKDRKRWFEWAKSLRDVPLVLFEAPHRLDATLTDIRFVLGNRPITIARELTKVHEQWRTGTAEALAAHFRHPRGEFVLVLEPEVERATAPEQVSDAEVAAYFGQITESGGFTRRETLKRVAERFQCSQRAVYAALERHKSSGS